MGDQPATARHFLTLQDLRPDELHALIARAVVLKAAHRAGGITDRLRGRVLAMIFEKASTRTRVSFETAMAHLGGHTIFLDPETTQLGRGETIADSARVLSRMVDVLVIRTFAHAKIEEFARHSRVPVINALTDEFHPCQLLADVMTWVEKRGPVQDKRACFVGDGNNVCHSWMDAAALFGFSLRVSTPSGHKPQPALLERCRAAVEWMEDPRLAVEAADVVVTDVWTSMGQQESTTARNQVFTNYQVNDALMALAAPDALFMHCLPAHRGEEVTASVIDGSQSVVWQEAENRLHAQKALLELLLG